MIKNAKWIWVNGSEERTSANCFAKDYRSFTCRFAEFEKEYSFDKKVEKIRVEISADTKYFLYINGEYIGVGPSTPGGDYNCPLPMPQQYYNTYEIPVDATRVRVYALVQTLPTVQCDMTQGRNGLICACTVFFADGTSESAYSDESWRCRFSTAPSSAFSFDFTKPQADWKNAVCVSSVWNLFPSEIENTVEETIPFAGEWRITKAQTQRLRFELDKIYSGYYAFQIEASGKYRVRVFDYEKDEEKQSEAYAVVGEQTAKYRSVVMTSAGGFAVEIENLGEADLIFKNLSFQFQHYPYLSLGAFSCNDEQLNAVYEMGRHALKICRQSVELDSPKHQENLQCAGDYHIASLMNYYADGDTRLTRFDLMRIARYLELSNGYMFHTTYSLIWVQMSYAYYMHSGDKELLYFIKPALDKLLSLHAKTVNEKGVIDKPLNYMFVDWIDVDGYNMHHPPKALGQTVLNAFYYEALQKGATVYEIIGETALQKDCLARAEKLKNAFSVFFDSERGLYFDGLDDEDEGNDWTPKNTKKRYYSWHSNTLAVLYGLAPAHMHAEIIERTLNDESLITPQPYFMHFVLEAIDKAGLFGKYGMEQLDRWKYMTEFGKGLVEGWMNCETYGYDYSHVWAGTPTYQLPSKLSGLKILEAGFAKISLQPKLFNLRWAKIKIPTPKGVIRIEMHEGQSPILEIPEGIQANIVQD